MRNRMPSAFTCFIGALVVVCVAHGCATGGHSSGGGVGVNPPAPGFDADGSDPRAIALADQTMAAMGGRDAWDRTRYITWNFFGMRRHVWDKHTGDVRIAYTDRETGDDVLILMNLHTREGRAWVAGEEVTETGAREAMLDRGHVAWINDSYWLVMPFKLKDTGVTLQYGGEAALPDGRSSDVVTVTFDGVGRTPENKYDVFIARDTKLVEQWAFYADAGDREPRFVTPWGNWQQYGGIMLSDERGPERRHTDVGVINHLPRRVFTDPSPIDVRVLFGLDDSTEG